DVLAHVVGHVDEEERSRPPPLDHLADEDETHRGVTSRSPRHRPPPAGTVPCPTCACCGCRGASGGGGEVRLYFEVARRTFARISASLAAAVAGVFTTTVFGFLLAYVLKAVYAERSMVGGFDEIDAVTFTFVAQGLLMPLGLFGATEFADRVRTGDVIVDLQ